MDTPTPISDGGDSLHDAVADAISRTIAIGALGGIALIHVLQSPDAFSETTYLGILFVGAIVASVLLGAVLTRTSDSRAWAAAGGLGALILLGYILSRTSGLPAATDDVGEWTEPFGLLSLVVEGLLVCVSAAALADRRYPMNSSVRSRRRTPSAQPETA